MPLIITKGRHASESVDASIVDLMPQHPEIRRLFRRGGEGLQKAFENCEIQPDNGPVVLNGYGLDEKFLICFLHSRHRMATQEMAFNYGQALKLAHAKQCESVEIRIPPFPNALSVIQRICAAFLEHYDMRIYLHVSSQSECNVPEDLLESLRPRFDIGALEDREKSPRPGIYSVEPDFSLEDVEYEDVPVEAAQEPFYAPPCASPRPSAAKPTGLFQKLSEYLKANDAGFGETLLKYIDRTGKKDSEIYKRANIDRKLFSKIRNNPNYNPSKPTAIAFAIALELSLEETQDLIGRAGYSLSHASTFDRIIEYYIINGNYNIYEINEALFYFDQSLLGC